MIHKENILKQACVTFSPLIFVSEFLFKKKLKKASFDQDSDVDIFPSDFVSETASRPRTGRARKEVKYFAESDEDDDFPMF